MACCLKKEKKKKPQLKENPLAPGLTQSKRWHSAMDQLKAFPEILWREDNSSVSVSLLPMGGCSCIFIDMSITWKGSRNRA